MDRRPLGDGIGSLREPLGKGDGSADRGRRPVQEEVEEYDHCKNYHLTPFSLAAELLKGTKLRLTGIVSKCGFRGLHQFERAMKKAHGLTPAGIRRAAKKEKMKF